MADEDNDFIEIETPENFVYGNKDFSFNHQQLVFTAYTKTLNALSQEMVEGFWEKKRDKFGNEYWTYNKDTRREAIETIKTLKNVMVADIQKSDENIRVNLGKLKEKEKSTKENFLKMQQDWWKSLDYMNQKEFIKKNAGFHPLILSDKSPYYHKYLNSLIEIYREIFEHLELIINDLKYYKASKIRG